MKSLQPCLEFLRYSIHTTLPLPESTRSVNWTDMMIWAEKQSVVGVIYGGIVKAGKELNIPFDNLMEWVGYASQIEQQNRVVNKSAVNVELSKIMVSSVVGSGSFPPMS